MMIRFDEDELVMMAMFRKESRRETMGEIRSVRPFISSDEEMLALVDSTLKKIKHVSDEEFFRLDLEPYAYGAEPMEDE